MGLDGESRRRFSLKFDFGGGKAKWKRGTNFSCPLSMGTMGGEDVQFFMATSFVLKRRATRLAGNARPFLFFLYYFLFLFSTLPPRIPHYYVYITSNSSLSLSLSRFSTKDGTEETEWLRGKKTSRLSVKISSLKFRRYLDLITRTMRFELQRETAPVTIVSGKNYCPSFFSPGKPIFVETRAAFWIISIAKKCKKKKKKKEEGREGKREREKSKIGGN